MPYENPAHNIRRPGISLVAAALLEPTVPRSVRGSLLDAFYTKMAAVDPVTLRRASLFLCVAQRALPDADPHRWAEFTGDPYACLDPSNRLWWTASARDLLVDRWDGLSGEGQALLAFGTGTVARIQKSLIRLRPEFRGPAWVDVFLGTYRRLDAYAVTSAELLVATVEIDNCIDASAMSTSWANAMAQQIRRPDALVPLVTSWTPAPFDPTSDEPPF